MACNKMSFASARAARDEIKAIAADCVRFGHPKRKWHTYQCPHCTTYHLTTKKQHRKY